MSNIIFCIKHLFGFLSILLFSHYSTCIGSNDPLSPPRSVAATILNSTTIRISWSPPVVGEQNGTIISYNLSYQGTPLDQDVQFISYQVPSPAPAAAGIIVFNLTGIEQSNTYSIRISSISMFLSSNFSSEVSVVTDATVPDGAPKDFRIVSFTSYSLGLSWSPPPITDQNGLITSYTIEVLGDPFPFSPGFDDYTVVDLVYPANAQIFHELTGLEENNDYLVRVRANNAIGFGPFTSKEFEYTDSDYPDSPPLNLTVEGVSATEVQLMWDPPSAIDQNGLIVGYLINYKGSPFQVDPLLHLLVSSHTFGEHSQELYDLLHYEDIHVDAFTPTDLFIHDTFPIISSTNFNLTGLEEFNNYSLRIGFLNQFGLSPPSIVVNFTTTIAAPRSPQSIFAEAVNSSSIRLVITPPLGVDQNGPILFFNISYTGLTFEIFTRNTLVNIANITYPLTQLTELILIGLDSFNDYIIEVTAGNAAGISSPANTTQRTNATVPSQPPRNLTGNATGTQISLRWNPPPLQEQNGPIFRYNISLIGSPFEDSVQYMSHNVSVVFPAVSAVYFTLTGRQAFNNYSIRVSAINGAGASQFTDSFSITTLQATPDSTPLNLTGFSLNTTSIYLRWDAPLDINQNGPISSYNLTYEGSPLDTEFRHTIVPVCATSYPLVRRSEANLTELEEFTNYTITVRAINGAGASLNVASVVVLTPEGVPGSPQLNSSLVINATAILIVWGPPIEIEQNGAITSYIISLTATNFLASYNRTSLVNEFYPVSASTRYQLEFTNVEEGHTYNISVRAVNRNRVGPSSNTIQMAMTPVVAPPNSPPFDPGSVFLSSHLPTSVQLNLPLISQAFLNGPLTGYTVRYIGILTSTNLFDTTNNSTNIFSTDVSTLFAPAGMSIILNGIFPNFVYLANISANNAVGSTAVAQLIPFLQPSSLPSGPPIMVQVSVESSSQATVTWDLDYTTINSALLAFNLYYSETGLSPTLTRLQVPVSTVGPYTTMLSNLTANKLHSLTISVINRVGEGVNSTELLFTTFPTISGLLPILPNTSIPSSEVSGSILIQIPTQNFYPDADIAVIFVLSDSSDPPVFSNFSTDEAFSSIASAERGTISTNGVPSIRIQAALTETYFDRNGLYFLFPVGNGSETSFNGSSYTNSPLLSGVRYELSYYIIFYDQNGQLTAALSQIGGTTSAFISPTNATCLECILLPVLLGFLILLVVVIGLVLAFCFYWGNHKRKIRKTLQTRNVPIGLPGTAKSEDVFTNVEAVKYSETEDKTAIDVSTELGDTSV